MATNKKQTYTKHRAALVCALLAAAASASAHTPDTLAARHIDRIVITGTRNATDLRHLPLTISVVDRQSLEYDHEPSLLPSLSERVPGLFATARGVMGYGVSSGAAGGMSLRGIGGSPTTALLVLVDGHPQYSGLMGHPIADACQTMQAEKVEVIRGPASVLYGGNAMGGVVNIVTRKAADDGVHTTLKGGYGSYNTVQSELAVSAKSGRFSGVVAGSYNSTDGHRPRMGFEQASGYAKAAYEFNSAWSIAADANVTRFDASNAGSVGAPVFDNVSQITRAAASIALRNDYGHTSGSVSLFHNRGEHKINDGYSEGATPPASRFRSHDLMTGLSVYQSVSFTQRNRLTAGVDLRRYGGRAWNIFIDGSPERELADKSVDEAAAYVDFRQSIGGRLTLDVGLRADRHSRAGTEWIPQAGVACHLNSSTDLKVMASKGFRFQTIREMYMFPPQNPDLEPERLMSYELSLTKRALEGALICGLNAYYVDGENMIVTVFTDGRPKYVNTGKIQNWGIEFSVDWQIDYYCSITANYSYLNMRYPVLAAPEHKLFYGINLYTQKVRFATGIQYVDGLYLRLAPELKERFAVWNASASYRFGRYASVYVRGENLLGTEYEINYGYPMPRTTVMGGVEINF